MIMSSSQSLPLWPFHLLLLIGNFLGGVTVVHGVDDYRRDDFPADFVFGAGTSAYQVEGAALEDGRTPSIWDTFAHSGYAYGNGDVACDGYHKYKEDIQLMADTGLEAYRFSISWSRLIPNGRGPVNSKGLQYYNNFINELISHGIQPHATIFHIDLPQVLEDEYGGWLNKKAVKDYVAYADVCFREFGDRVLHWTTFNEPNAFAMFGYDLGLMPPGRCSFLFGIGNCTRGNSSSEPYIVAHNLLLAHASAVRLYQRKYKAMQHGFVGINIYASWFEPCTNAVEDVIASQRATDFYVGWFVNPLVFGDYPYIVKKNAGSKIPTFTKLESKLIKGSFDFLGVNHYNTRYVMNKPSSIKRDIRDLMTDMELRMTFNGGDTPPNQFPVAPSGLLKLLDYLKRAYGNPPIYIHENGQLTPRNGSLNDTPRVEYLLGYIGSLLDAIRLFPFYFLKRNRNESNTRGYFVWSFLDVFELLGGYKSAFGLYYVDLDDKELRRYPKLSAQWYSNFLKGRNISQEEVIVKVEEKESTSSQFHLLQ